MKKVIKSLLLVLLVSIPIISQEIQSKKDLIPDDQLLYVKQNSSSKALSLYGSIGISTQYDYLANSIQKNSIIVEDSPFLISRVKPFSTFPPTQSHIVLSEENIPGTFSHYSVFGSTGSYPTIDIFRTGPNQGLLGISATPDLFALRIAPDSFLVKSLPGNDPSFVFSNEKIFLVTTNSSNDHYLFKSDDLGTNYQLIDSLSNYHPAPIFGLMQSECEMFKSQNEQHIVVLGTNSGNGHVFSGIPENEADNVWILYSNDFGNTWTGKTIGVDGKPNSVTGYHTTNFAPLFENFGQVSGTVSNDGVIHIVANGYGVNLDSPTGFTIIGSSFPVLYWNSLSENWISISNIAIDTMQSILNYYPPNSIGQAYPSISVSEDGQTVYTIWTGPQLTANGDLDIADNGGGDFYYWRDLYHTYSVDGGNTWVTANPISDLNTNMSDIFGQSARFLKTISSSTIRANIKHIVDQNTGVALFDGFLTDNQILYNYFDIIITSVDDQVLLTDFQLMQNYPNPFNPSTKISWQSPVGSHQTLKVFDVLGREVATLVDEYREAGSYEVEFNASELTSGVYFYQLRSDGFVETKKMILVK
jgi:hypothetical protein